MPRKLRQKKATMTATTTVTTTTMAAATATTTTTAADMATTTTAPQAAPAAAAGISEALFEQVGGWDKTLKPVIDVGSDEFKPHPTIFKYPGSTKQNPVPPTAENMMKLYFPLTFVFSMVHASNAYIAERKRRHPELQMWSRKRDTAPFTLSGMYHFIAILYNFGMVQLPSKADYCTKVNYLPNHNMVHELGMSRKSFQFMWRHFHIRHP